MAQIIFEMLYAANLLLFFGWHGRRQDVVISEVDWVALVLVLFGLEYDGLLLFEFAEYLLLLLDVEQLVELVQVLLHGDLLVVLVLQVFLILETLVELFSLFIVHSHFYDLVVLLLKVVFAILLC